MKSRKMIFHIFFMAVFMLFAACGAKEQAVSSGLGLMYVKVPSVTGEPDDVDELTVAKRELTDKEQELLEGLCKKAMQLYMVEPVETEEEMTVLVRERILSETPKKSDTAGEIVAQYELPYKIRQHNVYNFYYDGEIFAVAEGAWSDDYPEETNQMLSILVSRNGGEFERMEIGETESVYLEVYFDFGENGRIAVLAQEGIFSHEVFLRADSTSDWRKLGTEETFHKCYGRLVSCISFFDGTTGVVGTPLVDPWYTNFIRTEDAGENWSFAEKELLEAMPDFAVTQECGYSVISLHCEGNIGAALVRVEGWKPDGSYAYYLYTTVDRGKTWQIGPAL